MYFSYIGDIDDPEFHWDKPEDAPSLIVAEDV
jgi:hypothetical protein